MSAIDLVSLRRAFEEHGVAFLQRFVALRSLSPAFDPTWERHGELERALELAADAFSAREIPRLAITVSRIPGRSPALIVTVPGTSPGTALLYGHLDKQPAQGPWHDDTDPFQLVREGDLLFGRGIVDDGYSVPVVVEAIRALADDATPRPTVIALFEASEESGSPDLEAHLDANAAQLGVPDLVVCLDAGGLDTRRLWRTTSLRGNLVVTVSVAVLEHGVHSGEAGGVVPETFRILRALVDRIEDASDGSIRIPELQAPVPPAAREAARRLVGIVGDPFAAAYPLLPGVRLEGEDPADRLVRQSWATTLALTGMDGVPSVPEGGNVLRPSLTAKLSLRLGPTVEAERALQRLIEVLSADPPLGAQVRVTAEAPAQGWVSAPLPDWLETALEEASQAAFGATPLEVGVGGSIPFLASLSRRFPTTPIVATGALAPTSNAHGPDEHLVLTQAVGVTGAVAAMLAALAAEREGRSA